MTSGQGPILTNRTVGMATYTQEGRFMAVSTPLGKDVLLLDSFSAKEEISRLFVFKLGMFAEDESKVQFDKLLGQKVTVSLEGDPKRYFNGIVSRLSQGQRQKGLQGDAMMIR